MAITTIGDADYDPIFKRNYLKLGDNLYSTFDNAWAIHKKTFGTLGGKDSRHPVEVTFGGGVGSSTNGSLPVANNTAFIEPVYTAKRVYARINIDNYTIESSEKTEHAFVRALDKETTGKLKSFNRNMGRILMNDGSGILGQFSGSASGTAAAPTVTILTTGTYACRDACFEVGDFVNVNTLTSYWEITAFDRSSKVLTLARRSGSDDLTAIGAGTHSVYMQGSRNADPYGYLGILNDSSFYGVSAVHRWQPVKINAASAPLDTEMLTEMVEKMEELSDESFTHLIFSPKQYRKYIQLLEDQKRFPVPVDVKPRSNKMTNPDLLARVAFGGIQYVGATGNITCMKNKFVRDDVVIGLNTNQSEIRHIKKPGWASRDGTVFLRMEDYDGYEARYLSYPEVCINPFYVGFVYGLA